MNIEYNRNAIKDTGIIGDGRVMITPPIDENYWIMRVPLSQKQAVVCFPKFGVIGIGFQHEEDWNTNLPSGCDATEIFNHIRHNKGDEEIADADCIKAIQMIKNAINELRGES